MSTANATINQIPEIIVSPQSNNTNSNNNNSNNNSVGTLSSLSAMPSADDLRRMQVQAQAQPSHRPYDDFDSDDELRREEINFMDGGNFNLYFSVKR